MTLKTGGRLGLLLAALVVTGAASLRAEILEQILVKVNGDIITKTSLEERQVLYLRQERPQMGEEDLRSDAELMKVLAEVTPRLIVEAIDELLLVQRGRELGYRLGDDQFRSILENIKKENKIETEEQFNAALKRENMTLDDLRRNLERQMLISRVSQQELGRIGVTEEEAQRYYTEHADEFRTTASVTLREILIEVPTQGSGGDQMLNVGRDEQAREQAEAIRARVLAGEDFARLAAEVSDAPSKANGGLVGPLDVSELAPALQQMLENLKVGDVSEPVRTGRGYHLVKLESATESVLQPLADVRDQIADKVYNEKRRAEFEKFMRKLRAQAIIEWKSDELKKAWEEQISRRASADPTS